MSSKSILLCTALLAGALTSSANVTVQGWWHLDNSQPINDSSGNNRTFGSAYSTAPAAGGAFASLPVNNGAGGPLGSVGYSSTECIQVGVGVGGKRQSAMWGLGYNPPAQNYGIEIWVLPQDNGVAGGTGGWIFSSGQGGGVALRINSQSGGDSYIDAFILGTSTTIGDRVTIDTNRWMHLALVNDGGITTFYTNGVPCGLSDTNHATTPAGDVYIGTPSDNQAYYGYLDEARMFTFAAGAFSTSDLLLRPAGPNIIGQPKDASVWAGGAAPFTVNPSFDFTMNFQWRIGSTLLAGSTASTYVLPTVSAGDSGNIYSCVLTSSGLSITSAPAKLTVVPPNGSDVSTYRSAILSEATLLAYFPVDGDSGATLSNAKDNVHNGALEGDANYDGRTNTSFGQRAVSFSGHGDVQIPNNTAFEFSGGNGTIEALVYLSQPAATDPTIFGEGTSDQSGSYLFYALRASKDGSSLIYATDTLQLSWPVPGNLVGRLAHVAVVVDHLTNVTAYVDGSNLGTKTQTGFGGYPSSPAWIGAVGNQSGANGWYGSIDELAVYGSALSQNTIQTHYSKFFYGTNTAAPSIVSQPSSKTLLAGGSPVLTVKASGTLPLTYQWTSNGVALAGATSASLTLPAATTAYSASYSLTVQNGFGSTNTQPIELTFTAPPAGYPATVMSDHPTAFWRLAESSGLTMIDSAGVNDGTYSAAGVSYGTQSHQGEPGTAVTLDGASGRALVPNSPALNPNGPFTIEFWASLTSYGFWVPVSSMNRPSRDSGYEFYINGNSPGYEFHTAAGGNYNMITEDGNVPPNGTWSHVVGVFDTTNIYLYVDGNLGNIQADPPAPAGTDDWITEGAPPFAPNITSSFFVGSRTDNTHFFSGAMSDVAFYNYALSPAQIASHWASAYQASHIVQQPAGVTNVEGSTIVLSPVIDGLPNKYQWYKDNVALTPSLNFDQSPHFPQDVTNLTLTISEAKPSDSGQYKVVVSNPLGGSTSANAAVLITADTNPPAVTSVTALGTPNRNGPTPFLIKVLFNTRIDPVTGANPANYTISGGVAIAGNPYVAADLQTANFGSDWKTVFLATSGLTPGQKYTVTVNGVKDQAQTPRTISSSVTEFTAPVLKTGVLDWDYYYIGGSVSTSAGVTPLTGAPSYIGYAPNTNVFLTEFDSHQITGGDLNNVPGFASLGDNYGSSLSGWITPTVPGDYTFFLASDDASELWMSTDANPMNATLIAQETGCCHGFQEPGNPTTSSPQTLQAGHSYFIQALHIEGGGGDYVEVAWRLSTDSTASTNLPPIQAQVLSAYAPQSQAPAKFNQPVLSNGQVTLSWTGTGTLLESTDLKTWTTVPGNPPSPYIANTAAAPLKFYRISQ